MYRIEPNNIAIEIPVAVLFWLVNASLKKLRFPSTTLKTIDYLRMDVKYYVPASTLKRDISGMYQHPNIYWRNYGIPKWISESQSTTVYRSKVKQLIILIEKPESGSIGGNECGDKHLTLEIL
jgi:hypothetical protein